MSPKTPVFVIVRFQLDPAVVAMLHAMRPRFGFDGFGEMLFYRTYSRKREDGTNETWADTVVRVINGVMSIAKDHYVRKVHREWDEAYWQQEAATMAYAMFDMHWLPPGRGLWIMGTEYLYERGSLALYNCSFVDVRKSGQKLLSADAHWLMDALMCGVGVGFSAGSTGLTLQLPTGPAETYVIPDTREGWCESVRRLLVSFEKGASPVNFDYSAIRAKGLPIKGFGGVSAGPRPLRQLHRRLRAFCRAYVAKRKGAFSTYTETRLVADVMNAIGACVVAGNIRRSAQIAVGSVHDETFNQLKNWYKVPERRQFMGLSNNSVRLEEDSDFVALPRIAERIRLNGEPGFLNMINIRKYGRFGEEIGIDRATGANPCVTGDTRILTVAGPKSFAELADAGKDVLVYAVNKETNEPVVRWMRNPRKTKTNAPVVEVCFDSGLKVRATPDHKFITMRGEKVRASELRVGQSVSAFNLNLHRNGHLRVSRWLRGEARVMHRYAHRMVAEAVGMDIDGKVMHHKDGNPENNAPENLAALADHSEHNSLHYPERATHGFDGKYERTEALRAKLSTSLKAHFAEHGTEHLQGERVERIAVPCGRCGTPIHVTSARAKYRQHVSQGGPYCSTACSNAGRVRTNALTAEEALSLGLALSEELGRVPSTVDWLHHRTPSMPSHEAVRTVFGSWAAFKAALTDATAVAENHKVVSVTWAGTADVYNGTVDEVHTYVIVDPAPINTRARATGILSANCGEIPLESYETCNLSEVFPTRCPTSEEFFTAVRCATTYATIVSWLPTHRPETNKVISRNRRIGVSLSGVTDWMGQEGLASIVRKMRDGYKLVRRTNAELAETAGVRPAIRVTTVKPSGCRPWNALTTTTTGIYTLEELFSAHQDGATWSDARPGVQAVQRGSTPQPITKTYVNGVAPVYRVRMACGLEVESTANHQWSVVGQPQNVLVSTAGAEAESPRHRPIPPTWIPTADLRPGHVLDVRLGTYAGTRAAPLKRVPTTALAMRGDATQIRQPAEMTEELAWLMGYLWGDGSMSPAKYRVRWIDASKTNLQRVIDVLANVFGIEATMHPASQHRAAWTVEVGSKHLWHWLIANGVWKYDGANVELIPTVIRESARTHILAFVAGLIDSDGWSGLTPEGTGKWIITTADERFARHLQDVCWAVGLGVYRSHNTGGTNLQTNKSMWLLGSTVHMDPEAAQTLVRLSGKVARVTTHARFRRWGWERPERITTTPGKVVAIDYIGELPTYDIEVAESHWYYAGAVRSHNTISKLAGVSSGCHFPEYSYFIRRVRIAKDSPICAVLDAAGVPHELDVKFPDTTMVYEFPQASSTRPVSDVSMWEQGMLMMAMQRHWADNMVSVTVKFDPDTEGAYIEQFLAQVAGQVKSLSMLPTWKTAQTAYPQMPEEAITREEYLVRVASIHPFNWSSFTGDGQDERFCDNGACQLVA